MRPATRRRRSQNKQIEEILDLLFRRRYIILTAFVLALAGGLLITYLQKPVFQASAVVMVDLGRAQGSSTSAGPVVDAGPFVRDNRSVATELFVLQSSRGIRERVAKRMRDRNGRMPAGVPTFSQASREVPNAIQITVTSPDPLAAAALANAYAEEYVEQTRIGSRSYLTTTRGYLEEQAARLKGELNAAEGKVEGRMAAGGVAALAGNGLVGQASSLKSQRNDAMIELQTSRSRLASINQQLADIQPRLAERMSSDKNRRLQEIDQAISDLYTQRRTYENYESGQGRDVSQRPEVVTIDRRIADLQAEKASLASGFVGEVMEAGGIVAPQEALGFVSTLKADASQEQIKIDGLQARIGQLNAQINRLEGQIAQVPGATTSVERAQRDQQNAAQMYQAVVNQLNQVRLQEESEPGYARILKEASVPFLPAGAGSKRTLLLMLLAGLGLGVALAVARDRVDNRVHKPEHVAELGVPVLEAVPDLKKLVKEEMDGAETVDVDGRPIVSEVVTLHAPLSPASETFKHLRTAVQFSRPDVVIRTVVVTSAGPGEGKSTTAANLAVTFAQAGRKTVLVDADLRRPRLHEVFGMPSTPGLAQLVEVGPAAPDDLLRWLDGAFRGGVDGLYVLPTGAVAVEREADGPGDGRVVVPNPSEFLGSPATRALLNALLEVVDVIVIDTPPVLAATDAVLLSTQADATLLVTSAGKTKAGDIEQALSHLDDVGAKVVGAVLNRFTLENALGYVYTYGHYSRYGPYSKYGPYTSKPGKTRRRRGQKLLSSPKA